MKTKFPILIILILTTGIISASNRKKEVNLNRISEKYCQRKLTKSERNHYLKKVHVQKKLYNTKNKEKNIRSYNKCKDHNGNDNIQK